MGTNAVKHLPTQVAWLENLENANALVGMQPLAVIHILRQGRLAGVSERGMPTVVRKPDRFSQRFIQPKRHRQCPPYLGDLEGVSHARNNVIALRINKDLGLVFQPAKRLGVEYPVAIALELCAQKVRSFLTTASAAVSRAGRERRELGFASLAVYPMYGSQRRWFFNW